MHLFGPEEALRYETKNLRVVGFPKDYRIVVVLQIQRLGQSVCHGNLSDIHFDLELFLCSVGLCGIYHELSTRWRCG